MEESSPDVMLRPGLERYLAARFEQQVTIGKLRRPTATGFSADTMILDLVVTGSRTESADRPSRLVVQAAPTGPALFEDYDLARSFAVQRELSDFGVPVANMRWLCEDSTWIGTPFYVMDFVEGRVPPDRPPYHVEGWLIDDVLEKRSQVWMAGIDAMGALHRVPVDQFSFLDPDAFRSADVVGQRVQYWRSFGLDLGQDAEPALLGALDVLERTRPECGPLGVHWGDAKLGNMIFHQYRAAAILDWELCGLGVGEEDLAHWMAVDWFLSSGIGFERLAGLPDPQRTIAAYESIVGRSTIGVEWWFAFALVRMGLIFQRAAVQSRRRRGDGGPLRPNAIAPHLQPLLDGTVWAEYSDQGRGPTIGQGNQ